ncbi:unnamed protein product [Protopolystoma xenopodis]|uniref:Uncharacterized protein n=1 Tax=Protopolystoma xenopodis TaxID=117903 RepID=A0A3S5CHP6_9PLAT|nr:unnamed protein product [Protopolystoma xenopodis]
MPHPTQDDSRILRTWSGESALSLRQSTLCRGRLGPGHTDDFLGQIIPSQGCEEDESGQGLHSVSKTSSALVHLTLRDCRKQVMCRFGDCFVFGISSLILPPETSVDFGQQDTKTGYFVAFVGSRKWASKAAEGGLNARQTKQNAIRCNASKGI